MAVVPGIIVQCRREMPGSPGLSPGAGGGDKEDLLVQLKKGVWSERLHAPDPCDHVLEKTMLGITDRCRFFFSYESIRDNALPERLPTNKGIMTRTVASRAAGRWRPSCFFHTCWAFAEVWMGEARHGGGPIFSCAEQAQPGFQGGVRWDRQYHRGAG
ncbi:MAG: hypothetical protein C0613_03585 [Desulfobulbaceae bacterium]|nr:MAG: hypothetical protein C0613_03585 [Desulfobulbaceae bacterium]